MAKSSGLGKRFVFDLLFIGAVEGPGGPLILFDFQRFISKILKGYKTKFEIFEMLQNNSIFSEYSAKR